MWKDPIVEEETRSRREELARCFNYDIKAIGEAVEAAADGEREQIGLLAHRSVFELLRHNTVL